jgi:hypothetical protein
MTVWEANPQCPYCAGSAMVADEEGRWFVCRCARQHASEDHRTGCTCWRCTDTRHRRP